MALDADTLRRRLPGRKLVVLETTTSTMDEAARLAAAGCPDGTIVAAGEQTAGRGRHGHTWHSQPDAGLYASFVLRLDIAASVLPVLTLATGLAVQDCVRQVTGLEPDLRWPNDLMLGRRKLAGVLLESAGDAVIAGVGLNVNHTGFPAELEQTAISLQMATGCLWSREQLLESLSGALEFRRGELARAGPAAILQRFAQASTYVRGRRVTVDLGDTIIEGVTAGLDSSGFLLLDTRDGERRRILAGGVRLLED